MRVRLAYGQSGLDINVDARAATVLRPACHEAAADQMAVLRAALRDPVAGPPLRERVRPGQTVAISACDGSRAQPRHLMIPAVLEELDGIVRLEDVVILVATGTQRGNSEAELRRMFGDEIVDGVRIVNHDARDSGQLTWMGTYGDDVPVWLNREWAEADVRITTGFVEPHFFAGFSGGPKLVAPGLAALETVLVLHDAARIGDPRATWGITHGNPVHDDVRAIAQATGVTFALDVVLNRDKDIVTAFGGDLLPMHAAATAVARRMAMRPVEGPFDVVVTTNSGFPLDQNLYQCVEGMSAAYQVVRPGGTIVCAAECRDGFPDHGSYREVLASAPSPQALVADLSARTHTVPDQWQAQIQARIQSSCRVVMYTEYLSDAELATAHLAQTADISTTVATALAFAGPDARVCVLTEGPQTIPYLKGDQS
ncbi:nickel-dependent lactate racemase [Streptomyces sp. NPDC050287]|uniref:nickel-dependent lactate racemase n=1 Tax=Streptomyces sp. NPDC050287 TaxID=3365608 RepID=UPI00378CE611